MAASSFCTAWNMVLFRLTDRGERLLPVCSQDGGGLPVGSDRWSRIKRRIRAAGLSTGKSPSQSCTRKPYTCSDGRGSNEERRTTVHQ